MKDGAGNVTDIDLTNPNPEQLGDTAVIFLAGYQLARMHEALGQIAKAKTLARAHKIARKAFNDEDMK